MDFVLPDGHSIRVLAPFADMLNHSSEVKPCHAYNVSSGNLSVLAGKDYEAGDQVCSSCSLMVISYQFVYVGTILSGFYLLWTHSEQSPFTSLWLCGAW